MNQATRHDNEKIRMDLVPSSLVEGVAKVLTFGAKKYDAQNWRKGMSWSRCIGSLKRHLNEFEKGINVDEETGFKHLEHLACNVAFLIEYYKTHPELDDRWKEPQKRIALDIDDVCAAFVPAYCKKVGIDVPNSWYLDYNFIPNIEKLHQDEEFWMNLEPLFNPTELKFEPAMYITARDEKLAEWTTKWLEKHNFPKAPVIFSRNKGATCKENNIQLFIDDSPKNFDEINQAGVACFLMDTIWNKYRDVGYRRISHVNDII